MKFSNIFLNIKEQDIITKDPEISKTPAVANSDELRSNIDQFWMNTDDLKSDLFKFLKRVQNKDPELARSMRNTIRTVISKFRYNPEQGKIK